MASRLSLKARALRFLSQREYSRHELHRKLAIHASSATELADVLDTVQARGWLCDARFASEIAARLGVRYGVRRIQHELKRHALTFDDTSAPIDALKQTERDRATVVWRKKFGAAPIDASERARQYRFLMQRGFGAETIADVLNHETADR